MQNQQQENLSNQSQKYKKNMKLCKHQNKMIDQLMIQTVNQIWEVYDDDGNGVLDKEETRSFLQDYLKMMGGSVESEFDERKFEEIYAQLDADKSGEMDKDEMINLLFIINNIQK